MEPSVWPGSTGPGSRPAELHTIASPACGGPPAARWGQVIGRTTGRRGSVAGRRSSIVRVGEQSRLRPARLWPRRPAISRCPARLIPVVVREQQLLDPSDPQLLQRVAHAGVAALDHQRAVLLADDPDVDRSVVDQHMFRHGGDLAVWDLWDLSGGCRVGGGPGWRSADRSGRQRGGGEKSAARRAGQRDGVIHAWHDGFLHGAISSTVQVHGPMYASASAVGSPGP